MATTNKPIPKWKKAEREANIVYGVFLFILTCIGLGAGTAFALMRDVPPLYVPFYSGMGVVVTFGLLLGLVGLGHCWHEEIIKRSRIVQVGRMIRHH